MYNEACELLILRFLLDKMIYGRRKYGIDIFAQLFKWIVWDILTHQPKM